eukprot:13077-Heterococcus_DN1.PRE.1
MLALFDIAAHISRSLMCCIYHMYTSGTGKTRTILGLVSVLLHRRVDVTATATTDDELSQTTTAALDTDTVRADSTITGATATTAKASKKQRRPTATARATRSHDRLLLCAPSNGAVDELVERLVTVGVYDRNGTCVKPRTIRIGRPPPTASDAVKSVTLQNRVAAALKVHPLRIEADDCARAIDKLQQQLNTINKQLDNPITTASTGSSAISSSGSSSSTNSKSIDTATATASSTKAAGGSANAAAVMSSRELLIERKRVTIELGVKRRRRREAYAALDAERKRVRNNILDNAQSSTAYALKSHDKRVVTVLAVIAALTLLRYARACHHGTGFDHCIIDEAAQAVETAILIPLTLGCKQLILVGDPRQLPATIKSKTAAKRGYDISLFERLERAGHPIHLLNVQLLRSALRHILACTCCVHYCKCVEAPLCYTTTHIHTYTTAYTQQYRMHPEIRAFPSAQFYSNKLVDAPSVISRSTITTNSSTTNSSSSSTVIVPHYSSDSAFAPLRVYDLNTARESRSGVSYENSDEAQFAYDIVAELKAQFDSRYDSKAHSNTIAILTPYSSQVSRIKVRRGVTIVITTAFIS